MSCTLTNVTCYGSPGNSTAGLTGMLDYVRDSTATTLPITGGSLVGIAILLPTFLIIFLILGRQRPITAFAAASFVCLIASFPLIALNYLGTQAIGLFLIMTVAGVAFAYSEDNP